MVSCFVSLLIPLLWVCGLLEAVFSSQTGYASNQLSPWTYFEVMQSATRGALGFKKSNKFSYLEFRACAACNSVLYSTASQQRCISVDWEVLGELNLVWYSSSAFFSPSVRKPISWVKESVAKRRCCSIKWRSLPNVRTLILSWETAAYHHQRHNPCSTLPEQNAEALI